MYDKNPSCYIWYQIFVFYFVKLGSIQKSQCDTQVLMQLFDLYVEVYLFTF